MAPKILEIFLPYAKNSIISMVHGVFGSVIKLAIRSPKIVLEMP